MLLKHFFSFVLAVSVFVSVLGCASLTGKKKMSQKERAEILMRIGNGALVEGDPTTALQNLLQAEKVLTESSVLQHSIAVAFYRKNDINRALEYAERSVELDSNSALAQNTLGALYMKKERFREAKDPLMFAAKDPLNREAYKARTNLGILHYKLGDYKKAKNNLDVAVRSEPIRACKAYYYKGHILLRSANFDRAISNYKKASEKLCGGFSNAHFALGVAYSRNKNYELARKKFVEVHQLFPESEAARQALDRLKFLP